MTSRFMTDPHAMRDMAGRFDAGNNMAQTDSAVGSSWA